MMTRGDFAPLIEDLNRPIHREKTLDESQSPCEGEFTLDEGWRIVVDSQASGAYVPAAHLSEYLTVSFGLELPVIWGGSEGTRAIAFSEDGARFGPGEEAYEIESAPTGVSIRAGGRVGFWQAVFYLEHRMGFRRSPILPELSLTNRPLMAFRIHRSFLSSYWKGDLLPPVDPYPDVFLCRLAHYGVNGIWLHGLLRELVPSGVFEGFGQDSDRLMGRLNELIERASRYGIKVYFYMCEPRGLPAGHELWERYPHVRGESSTYPCEGPAADYVMWSGTDYAFCTSTREVKDFLRESSRELFLRAPGLGGLILITASEHHTHCFSHLDRCGSGIDFQGIDVFKEPTCPRCKDRDPREIVCEVVNCLEEGVHSAAPEAKVIAWNWSWAMYEPEPYSKIIGGLAPGATLMCDFERGGEITRFGKTVPVDEYSLSYIGPSRRFLDCTEVGKQNGLEVAARLQLSAAHEVLTSGYAPLPYNVYEKCRKLRDLGVDGAMTTWNFGNYPSPSLEVAGWYGWAENTEDIDWLLRGIITRDYGPQHVEDVLEVYRIIREAFDYFPVHQALVFRNPMNRGPAYPFYLIPDGRPMALSFCLDDVMGDSLEDWTSGFGPEITTRCFEALADECEKAQPILDRIEQDPDLPSAGRLEVAVCRAVYHQGLSSALLMRFILVRNSKLGTEEEGKLTDELRDIVGREIQHLEDFLPYVEAQCILGFHGEPVEYLYTADAIRSKIRDLQEMLTRS